MKKTFFTFFILTISYQNYSQTSQSHLHNLRDQFWSLAYESGGVKARMINLAEYSAWNSGEHSNMGQANLANNWNSIREAFLNIETHFSLLQTRFHDSENTFNQLGSLLGNFDGSYGSLSGLPSLVVESITEVGNTGVRLTSANADLYGDIGNNALDLTFSNTGTDVSSGATGDSSVALGENTTASGTFSTAIGVGSQATGQGSIALGSGNIASGNYSTVSGFENVASGTMSVALGDKNQSSGWGSAAFGQETTASGNYSFTAGINTTASVGGAVAMGTNSVASGAESVAIGLNPTASGDVSIALGNEVVSSGDNSFASGIGTNAIGNFSTAMGINSFANGQGSTAMGSATKANGLDSTAMGWNNQANGGASTAMGGGTIASDYASLAIGYFNDSGSTITGSSTVFDSSNTAFIIGNGADNDNRSDALVVKFDGTTTIAGDLNINSDARLKANIISLGSTLAKLLQIDGKTYTMKKDENGKQKIGLLAQDIEKVFPELVSESNRIKSVNYQGLVPVLINALKEQDVLIKEQQRILSEQQTEVHELKSMMQKIIERL